VGPYLHHYSDDDEYEAYKIRIRGHENKHLMGYVKKGSVAGEIMKKKNLRKVENGRNQRIISPMTLKLVYPPDAQSAQCVEITEVISSSWFIP
jgi:hypothetical protein